MLIATLILTAILVVLTLVLVVQGAAGFMLNRAKLRERRRGQCLKGPRRRLPELDVWIRLKWR